MYVCMYVCSMTYQGQGDRSPVWLDVDTYSRTQYVGHALLLEYQLINWWYCTYVRSLRTRECSLNGCSQRAKRRVCERLSVR